MFIPLAPTTSSSSLPTSPVDDGISTVKQYLFIHSNKIRTSATIKKYYCNWQENIKCRSHCIYTSTCPYRCCPEMCGYCSRGNCNTQTSQDSFYAGSDEKDLEGYISRCPSIFSWDSYWDTTFSSTNSS